MFISLLAELLMKEILRKTWDDALSQQYQTVFGVKK